MLPDHRAPDPDSTGLGRLHLNVILFRAANGLNQAEIVLKSIDRGIYRWCKTPIHRFYGVKGNPLICLIPRRCNDRCEKCGIWKTPECDSDRLPVEQFLDCLNRRHENLYQVPLTGR